MSALLQAQAAFIKITRCSAEDADKYLRLSRNDLEHAVGLFCDEQEARAKRKSSRRAPKQKKRRTSSKRGRSGTIESLLRPARAAKRAERVVVTIIDDSSSDEDAGGSGSDGIFAMVTVDEAAASSRRVRSEAAPSAVSFYFSFDHITEYSTNILLFYIDYYF